MPSSNEAAVCRSKRRYPNDAAAQAALKRIKRGWFRKSPNRSYRCPVCGGYHLTSSPRR